MAVGRDVKLVRLLACVVVCAVQAAALARCTDEPPATPPPAPAKEPSQPVKPQPVPAQPATQAPGTPAAQSPATATPPVTTPVEPDPYTTPANPTLEKIDIKLGGRVFHLEMALTDQQRYGGLSGRTEIAADGGMIFVFKQPARRDFVMRDCPADIDIIYVDALGNIMAMHNMKAGPRRTEAERKQPPVNFPNTPKWAWTNDAYEQRLKKYTSRFNMVIAIELKGGTLNINGSNPGGLEFKVNDKLDLDIKALQAKAE